MTLAEQIGEDVRAVFLLPDDFAREREWQGKKILVVEDADKLREMQSRRDDLRAATKMIYADAADIGEAPSPTAYVTYDGRRYRVNSAAVEEGMMQIILEELRR